MQLILRFLHRQVLFWILLVKKISHLGYRIRHILQGLIVIPRFLFREFTDFIVQSCLHITQIQIYYDTEDNPNRLIDEMCLESRL